MGGQDRDAGLGQQEFGVQTALVEGGAQDRDVGGTAADRDGGPAGVAEQEAHLRHLGILGAALHESVQLRICLIASRRPSSDLLNVAACTHSQPVATIGLARKG